VLAYYLHDLSPFIVRFSNGMGLHWYGFAYVLAFLSGYWLYHWLSRHRYNDIPPDEVSDFITWAAVFGVMIGGRLGHILFYAWDETRADPLSAFKVWQGGMASHGGIIGLVLFTLWYSRKHHRSWTSIGDSLVVVAPIGLFLVRCANFVNGELWGKVISPAAQAKQVWWAVLFPKDGTLDQRHEHFPLEQIRHDEAVRQHLREILPPRYPSQLIEALLEGVVLFCLLWILRTRFRVPRGVLTGCFFIFYALLRIIGETFRVPDPAWHVGSVSAGQFLSLFMPLVGVIFLVWAWKTREYEAAFSPPAENP
jgi:phosphatidylglycerol:prolipoprotein diacylglycerol transferase